MFGNILIEISGLYDGYPTRTGSRLHLRKDDVLLWSDECGLDIEGTFNQIGVALARAFIAGSLNWDVCDGIANQLRSVLMDFYIDPLHNVTEPNLFWQVYLAFDNSEMVEADEAHEVAQLEIKKFLRQIPA
jgi:hypothetical protein